MFSDIPVQELGQDTDRVIPLTCHLVIRGAPRPIRLCYSSCSGPEGLVTLSRDVRGTLLLGTRYAPPGSRRTCMALLMGTGLSPSILFHYTEDKNPNSCVWRRGPCVIWAVLGSPSFPPVAFPRVMRSSPTRGLIISSLDLLSPACLCALLSATAGGRRCHSGEIASSSLLICIIFQGTFFLLPKSYRNV